MEQGSGVSPAVRSLISFIRTCARLTLISDENPVAFSKIMAAVSPPVSFSTTRPGAGCGAPLPGEEDQQYEDSPTAAAGPVCVTGATSFLGAFVVEWLLSRGYTVHGTTRARASEREKFQHLLDAEKSQHESVGGGPRGLLKLFHDVDLADDGGLGRQRLADALRGCAGAFHLATPIHIPLTGEAVLDREAAEEQQLKPALKGVELLLELCRDLGVGRVVLTSSMAAVQHVDPFPAVFSEKIWTDLAFAEQRKSWYVCAKTRQERLAWQLAKQFGLDLATICPPFVGGPLRTPHLNFSHAWILEWCSGAKLGEKIPNEKTHGFVHVEDVAALHGRAYEELYGRRAAPDEELRDEDDPCVYGRRYICMPPERLYLSEVCDMLRDEFPALAGRIPTEADRAVAPAATSTDRGNLEQDPMRPATDVAQSERVLGRPFQGVREILRDTVQACVERGHLKM